MRIRISCRLFWNGNATTGSIHGFLSRKQASFLAVSSFPNTKRDHYRSFQHYIDHRERHEKERRFHLVCKERLHTLLGALPLKKKDSLTFHSADTVHRGYETLFPDSVFGFWIAPPPHTHKKQCENGSSSVSIVTNSVAYSPSTDPLTIGHADHPVC